MGQKAQKKSCEHRMMDFLARRHYSEKELRAALKRSAYEYSSSEIDGAIESAKKHNYLLPPEELSQKVATRLHEKNKGHLYINNYLRSKGLPELNKETDLEIQKSLAIIKKKFPLAEGKNTLTKEEKQKIQRQLYNRGFDLETINKVIYEKL